MKKIYFVRHGESQSNVGGVMLGAETPLTEAGYKQAEYIAERCTKLPVEVVISSTMLRAHETGRTISEKINKELVLSDLFVERAIPTAYLGRLINDPEMQEIEQQIKKGFTDATFRYSDEETFEDLKIRATAALEFLKNRPEEHIVVTTHGTFLHVLFAVAVFGEILTAELCQATLKTMRASNTGITLLEYREDNLEAPWCVVTWNDHAHLG
jgi:2,3-bisphosphoglycerate-dependent phosphoglycerate mutase